MNSTVILITAGMIILLILLIILVIMLIGMNGKIKTLEGAISTSRNDTLIKVGQSIGEMRNISADVEDLRRTLSNVKSRGVIGEMQLEAIVEDILAPSQYEKNVAVKGGSERVEFAVKFPNGHGGSLYLPIDSKFPGDAFMNLMDAYDTGDKTIVKDATNALRNAITKAAKDIKTKYIYPPYTTEFGIMFLPFEGLYAEVLRLNLVERLQKEYRITVAGPSTMAAVLSGFNMGFKSIALRERSVEVWDTLEKVKTEFDRYDETLSKIQIRLDQTQSELEQLVGARTRGIRRVLKGLSEMPDKSHSERNI